tara:strand:- start:34 stop:996 length:963 start_codon:yes stop_codon:yes gene_type:complete
MIEQIFLVTGSAGFIGYHLCRSLLIDGFKVIGVDCLNSYYDTKLKLARLEELKPYKNFNFYKVDISDSKSMKKLFEMHRPTKVINLAAQAGVRYSIKNPNAYLKSNLVGFLSVIELCRQFNVQGLIYASSSSVYGKNRKIPFHIEDKVDKPISFYGATKRANELIAHSYSHLYGIHTTGLRYFTVYGPWGRPDMAYFIFTKNILSNNPIEVFNQGKMRRDFTFIDDIIIGTRAAIEKNFEYEIFNLGNNKSENLIDFISLIENELGKKAIIEYKPMQAGDVIENYADIDYSIDKLGYHPKTSINEGIKDFIKWYKSFYYK